MNSGGGGAKPKITFSFGSKKNSRRKKDSSRARTERGPLVGRAGTQYGLQGPGRKSKPASGSSIFGANAESDSDEGKPMDYNLMKYRKQKVKSKRREALAQDPTVFDYDGVYDNIQEGRAKKDAAVKAEKRKRESRYIGALIRKAKDREIEQAIIEERIMLKERELDDNKYGDKQKYVTSGYKKALKERELWMRERDRLDALDDAKAKARREAGGAGSGIMGHLLQARSVGEQVAQSETVRERVKRKLEASDRRAEPQRDGRNTKKHKAASAGSIERQGSGAAVHAPAADKAIEKPDAVGVSARAPISARAGIRVGEGKAATDPAASSRNGGAATNTIIAKRNTADKVVSARERYLARKAARAKIKEAT